MKLTWVRVSLAPVLCSQLLEVELLLAAEVPEKMLIENRFLLLRIGKSQFRVLPF
jgi:hypothetical protein